MAPVYHALTRIGGIEPLVLLTGQHRQQLAHALSLFHIPVAANLEVMTERQTLPELAARIMPQAAAKLREIKPDYVLVHGDTLTTFTMAWIAFLEKIPVAHVEAGLRSHDMTEPFPEEANRRLTDAVSSLDLAPTALARQNLLAEGKNGDSIVVTGQTGVDSILYAARVGSLPPTLPLGRYVTITLHRRENWPLLRGIAEALAQVAERHRDYLFVYPVHLNPVVREAVYPPLQRIANFVLTEPMEYGAMAALLAKTELIVTDSGGLQEEGATLQVPVVVVRNVTERPEGVASGILKIAGTQPENVLRVVDALLASPALREDMRRGKNPYGDGHASERVAQAVAWRLGLLDKPEEWR
jgi:UDP-N-acetylglucosamine 2-epimerase (non-hydrolysing)